MSTTTAYNELQSYFADLSILPRLSAQEEETLLCRLRLAQQGLLSPEQAHAAKHCLMEGYLYRVIRLAKEQQPFFHRFSLTEASITVERLAKAARVGEKAASDFLHVQRGTTRQARPRHKAV
jgi:hypothetical protein